MTTTASWYRYRVARADGTVEEGTVHALTADAASRAIGTEGRWVLTVIPQAHRDDRRATLPLTDLAIGLRLLASFLESGLPMAQSLSALKDAAPASWQPLLPGIQTQIREGRSLADALSTSSVAIPPAVLGLLRAGEAGSGFAEGVRRAADLVQTKAATVAALRSALAYPALLAAAAIAAAAVLIGVVLPRFAGILSELGQTLPVTTRLVLGAATMIRSAAVPTLVITLAVMLVGRAWIATPDGRRRWDAWVLAIPLIGTVRRAAATERFASTLSALLQSGVPLGTALRASADAVAIPLLTDRIMNARARVIAGERLSVALGTESAVTATALRLIRAGETSGRLSEMLHHAALLERERATHLIARAVRLTEPALILVFGGMVALVAAALLQAVYSVRPSA